MSAPLCPYCGNESELVTGRQIYPRSPALKNKPFYRCLPCDAHVGCPPDTTVALGRLANAALRKAKMAAHSVFDMKWRAGHMKRKDAYGWLAEQLGIERQACHIGMMDMEMCKRVVDVCGGVVPPVIMPSKHRTPYNQNRDKNYGKELDPHTGKVSDCRDRD